MTPRSRLTPDRLLERLNDIGNQPRARVLVAFSGGLDSAVLLHLASRIESLRPLLAVHVDHGLHADSSHWATQAREISAALKIDFVSIRREVRDQGGGLEAAAREVRYDFFSSLLETGDCLLSAQHVDDQAETLMLHLLRGSGPLGLSGMAASRRCGRGQLLRPLLDVSRADILQYAQRESLSWVEDPSNDNRRFDRNYLRHEVLPPLRARWPAAAHKLAQSASLAAEAQTLLNDLAIQDLKTCGEPGRLSVTALRALSGARQRNLLRSAARELGLKSIPGKRLEEILRSVLDARVDASPKVSWDGAEARRYRDGLYLRPVAGPLQAAGQRLIPGKRLLLGPGLGELELVYCDGPGINVKLAEAGLKVTARVGGERLRPTAGAATRALKTLFQEAGIPPWARKDIPLLTSGERVVAVADLWLESEFLAAPGYRVGWVDRPTLD